MNRKTTVVGLLAATVLLGVSGLCIFGRGLWVPAYFKIRNQRTVADVMASIGPSARKRVSAYFSNAGLAYPPSALMMLALKDSAQLEVWADPEGSPSFVHTYQIKALSGSAGPKLREGDRQVPEGLYRVDEFNPNSRYYLSMKLNYPNSFDLQYAKAEGRPHPGTDIFIHGEAVSAGCLAMGDEAIEELFVMVHDVGRDNVRIAIAPTDPRAGTLSVGNNPPWVGTLYRVLEDEFRKYVRSAKWP